MKKVGVRILVVLLCMPMVFANPTETDSLPEGMPKAQEFTRVTIGLTSVLYVALAEFSYMMGEEIPGMSGSVDFMGNTTDVSWSDCDLGALFSEDPSDAGSMIIKHGTHKVHIAGDTLENMIDVTISYTRMMSSGEPTISRICPGQCITVRRGNTRRSSPSWWMARTSRIRSRLLRTCDMQPDGSGHRKEYQHVPFARATRRRAMRTMQIK